MCASPAKDFDQSPVNLQTYVMTQLVSTSVDSLPATIKFMDCISAILSSKRKLQNLRESWAAEGTDNLSKLRCALQVALRFASAPGWCSESLLVQLDYAITHALLGAGTWRAV